jgi:hypothetical protein
VLARSPRPRGKLGTTGKADFWILETPNTIRPSKKHVDCHTSFPGIRHRLLPEARNAAAGKKVWRSVKIDFCQARFSPRGGHIDASRGRRVSSARSDFCRAHGGPTFWRQKSRVLRGPPARRAIRAGPDDAGGVQKARHFCFWRVHANGFTSSDGDGLSSFAAAALRNACRLHPAETSAHTSRRFPSSKIRSRPRGMVVSLGKS